MTISSPRVDLPPHISIEAAALLRSLLLCQLVERTQQVAQSRVTVGELTGEVDSDSQVERDMAEAAAAHFVLAMEETRAALRRLDHGLYGSCEACDAPIPFERLEAIPETRRCVMCPMTS